MASSAHLKFESIAKFTAAIKPMDAAPPINTPNAAPQSWDRNDVAAIVIVSTPVARTYPPITRNTWASHASRRSPTPPSCASVKPM